MDNTQSKVKVFEALPESCPHPAKKLLGEYCANKAQCPNLSHCLSLLAFSK